MTEAELFQSFILLFGGIIASVVSAILVYHYKKKSECFTTLKQTAYASKADIDLIKRFLVVQSRMIDTQTKNSHPETVIELEELAKQLLKDIDEE